MYGYSGHAHFTRLVQLLCSYISKLDISKAVIPKLIFPKLNGCNFRARSFLLITCVRIVNIIGASLSEPHIDETFMRELFIYIYIYVWYDRHPRRRSYTIHCAHSKIFRAIQTACYNVCVLHCASVQHTLPRVQAS